MKIICGATHYPYLVLLPHIGTAGCPPSGRLRDNADPAVKALRNPQRVALTSARPVTSASGASAYRNRSKSAINGYHLGHQVQPPEAGAGQQVHYLRHCPVIRPFVGAYKDALPHGTAPVGYGLQFEHQLVETNLGVVDEYLALDVD